MNCIKKAMIALSLLALIPLVGCAYGGATTVGKEHVVVLRNDGFLFGLMRKIYVCKVSTSGVSNCSAAEAP